MSSQDDVSRARLVAPPCYSFDLSPLGKALRTIIVIIPYLFAVTLTIFPSNMYDRLAVCNCISFTFRSGGFAIPSDGYFYYLNLCTEGV